MIPFYRENNKSYIHVTNTSLQEGVDVVRALCWRYNKAETMLASGIEVIGDLFNIMRTIQPTSGARTLWTSMLDLSHKEIEVYYREGNYSIGHKFYFENPY